MVLARMSQEELARYLRRRKEALWQERSSYDATWKDIIRWQWPYAGRFVLSDRATRGRPRGDDIINNTPTQAIETCVAGLMSNVTSPARVWHRFTTRDPELARYRPVRKWFDLLTKATHLGFAKSNFYQAVPHLYAEDAVFGTAAMLHTPGDGNTVMHYQTLTVGEYALAQDARQRVNTLYRQLELTVEQLVMEFGLDAVSDNVKNHWERREFDMLIEVWHCIEPRTQRDRQSAMNIEMPFASIYREATEETKVLRESGFETFPALCPRWSVVSSDVYGYGPGMKARGDAIQLQSEELDKSRAIKLKVRPPTQGPTQTKGQEARLVPGGHLTTDNPVGVRPVYLNDINLRDLGEDIARVEQRVNRAYYADLFRMMQALENREMTKGEALIRHEERLQQLGPFYESMQESTLEPAALGMARQVIQLGWLPPPPEELMDAPLDIEFVSVLALAQRLVGAAQVDRFLGTVRGIAGLDSSAVDNVDTDAVVDYYSDAFNVDPSLMREQSAVQAIREARAKALAAKDAANMANLQAGTAKLAAQAQAAAPADILSQFTGYNYPSPQGV